ncbi:hypothetical protein, partial [Burkholderia pseudomallei]|uniref:hypothetical protein n=1 Tax=Burkholderia pseudomallei TaxID=28450 RepID=UPI001F20BE12
LPLPTKRKLRLSDSQWMRSYAMPNHLRHMQQETPMARLQKIQIFSFKFTFINCVACISRIITLKI